MNARAAKKLRQFVARVGFNHYAHTALKDLYQALNGEHRRMLLNALDQPELPKWVSKGLAYYTGRDLRLAHARAKLVESRQQALIVQPGK